MITPVFDEVKRFLIQLLSDFWFRQNQPAFDAAGGFMDDDDVYQQRRDEISEAKQKSKWR